MCAAVAALAGGGVGVGGWRTSYCNGFCVSTGLIGARVLSLSRSVNASQALFKRVCVVVVVAVVGLLVVYYFSLRMPKR